jgi:endonuclease/exonuclease/phosphatase family metal-dependent hydrolase
MKLIIFICIAAIMVVAAGLVWYAAGPATPSKRFRPKGIVTFEQFEARAHRAMPPRITAVTYNIGYASGDKNNLPVRLAKSEVIENLDAMVGELKELAADVVFLQEVDFDSRRTFGIDQMDYLAKALKMPYAAYAVTWNKRYVPWPYWPPRVHFGRMLSGQAVLSRFPISEHSVTRFEKPANNAFWYNLFYIGRCAQCLRLDAGGETMDVWNVHLEAFDEEARRHQLTELANSVAEDDRTILVAGDFNEVPNLFLQNFSRKTSLKRSGTGFDHIFYAESLTLDGEGYETSAASDHFPQWATFTLKRP